MIAGEEYKKIDWWLVAIYLLLTFIGWISIYSAVYVPEHPSIFDTAQRYGMQFIWIVSSYIIAFIILFFINPKIYSALSWLIYGISFMLLVAVIFFGIEVSGSHSWFEIGPVRFQPAEIAKIATTLALASVMSKYGFQLKSLKGIVKVASVVLIPAIVIVMQKESGSALVFSAFIFVLYREGMSGWFLVAAAVAVIFFLLTLATSLFTTLVATFSVLILIRGFISKYPVRHLLFFIIYLPIMILSPRIGEVEFVAKFINFPPEGWLGITVAPLVIYHIYSSFKQKISGMWRLLILFTISLIFIFSIEHFFENVLQPHQKARIENLLGIDVDLKGAGYNVHQSKIAIGSGGFSGKGFLKGTQTKYNFVPEQSTDFIFCTIGEEWGFLGSSLVILLYLVLIIRIVNSAEKQKDTFNRIFGYSLASILFMHFLINIGMTIGLMPVIGIPLPFVSYGGSSLWSFTIFLFIFIRLDLDRRR